MKNLISLSNKDFPRRLTIVNITAAAITCLYAYVGGSDSAIVIPAVSLIYFFPIIFFTFWSFSACSVSNPLFIYLKNATYISIIIPPLVLLTDDRRIESKFYQSTSINRDTISIIFLITAVILLSLAAWAMVLMATGKVRVSIEQTRKDSEPSKESFTEQLKNDESKSDLDEMPMQLLGKGSSVLDKVISSIVSRATVAAKRTNSTLLIMIGIVVVGGGTSFGTYAFSLLNATRQLQQQRSNLASLGILLTGKNLSAEGVDSMLVATDSVAIADTSKFQHLSNLQLDTLIQRNLLMNKKYKEIVSHVKADFSETGQYAAGLKVLGEKLSFSWNDIAVRATIAALTLFLVQIFFNIYKYNQQQSNHLYSKAEIAELFKDENKNNSKLRDSFLAKLENTRFGKDPASPIEHVINALEKIKDVSK